ncbi:uncharacterized protein LOC142576490 isoform X4 [Dermacentor variabilis]|uniref:uncharacterized protein LOC142576490 isoform X4 n=1 Tax=Dermacentor variabilis TaxID=34621 RepID=UPI003F5B5660
MQEYVYIAQVNTVDEERKQDPHAPHANGCAAKVKRPSSDRAKTGSAAVGPDGRLSWAIAITCFVINFISSCFYRCTGMFFNSIMDTFGASRGDASVPVSLYGGFYNVAGAGHGIITSCSIVAVTQYFDKRRGIALGLNLAGPPVTSLVVPKLLEWLLSEYGLRGTFLLLGGCLANVPVLGMLLRNPPWEKNIRDASAALDQKSFTQVANGGTQRVSVVCNNKDIKVPGRISVEIDPIPARGRRRSTVISVAKPTEVLQSTTINVRRLMVADLVRRGTASNVNADRDFSGKLCSPSPEHRPSIASRRSSMFASSVGEASPSEVSSIAPTVSPKYAAMERRGTMMSVAGSMFAAKRLSLNQGDAFSRRGTVISVTCPSGLGNLQETTVEVTAVEARSSALRSLKEVLCAPRMYFHTLSFLTYLFFVDSYLSVMFDLGEDIGVPVSESVVALTLLSAMDTVGRFFVPFLSDYGLASTASLITACYLSLSVISALIPLVAGKLVFLAVSAILGLPGGYILVGTSERISTELGTDNLPMAYGVLVLVSAAGSFVRPPVVGAFRDTIGSYDGLFQLMAGMLALALLFNVGLWINGRPSSKKSRMTAPAQDSGAHVSTGEPLPTLAEVVDNTTL